MGFFNDALDQIGLALGGSGALTRETARKMNNGALPPTEQPTRQFDPDFFRRQASNAPTMDMGDGYLYTPHHVNSYYDYIDYVTPQLASAFNQYANGDTWLPTQDAMYQKMGDAAWLPKIREDEGWGLPWGKRGSGTDSVYNSNDFTPPSIDQYYQNTENRHNAELPNVPWYPRVEKGKKNE